MTYKEVFIFEFLGEWNPGKASVPRCLASEFTGDISERKRGIRAPDDFGPRQYPRWSEREMELPDWITPNEFIRHYAEIAPKRYDLLKVEDERVGRYLLQLSGSQYKAFLQLMTASLRSSFKKSLKAQAMRWLETPPERRPYPSPLSPKQWRCLTKWYR